MIRSLLLAALALLLAGPALAQNTVTFQFTTQSGDTDVAAGLTALIYPGDPEADPIEGVVGADGLLVLENLAPGTYYPYLAPNDQAFTGYVARAEVDADTGTFFGTSTVSPISPGSGLIRGRITLEESGEPIRNSSFGLGDLGISDPFFIAAIDGEGRFTIQAPPGTYQGRLVFYYLNGPSNAYRNPTIDVTLAASEIVDLDLVTQVVEFGALSGRVTDAETGAPIADVVVSAYAADGSTFESAETDANGDYFIQTFDNPEYVVFVASQSGYLQQYFDDALLWADATLVEVLPAQTRDGVDFALAQPDPDFSVSFAGTVSASDGTPLNGAVTVYNELGFGQVALFSGGVVDLTLDDVRFAGAGLTVLFQANDVQAEYFDDSPTRAGAQVLAAGTGATAFDLGDVVLLAEGETPPGIRVSGTVTSEESGQPLPGAVVVAQRVDAPGIRYAVTDAAGRYTVTGLVAGDYAVLFTEDGHVPEFYPDAPVSSEAEVLTLDANRDGVDGLMGGLNRPVGANRGAPYAAASVVEVLGVARADDGTPLGGALVTATGPDGVEGYALADGSGRFVLDTYSPVVSIATDRLRYQAESLAMQPADGGQLFVTLAQASGVSADEAPERSETALRVFPNPASGRATIALATPDAARIAVYDVLGREVLVATAGAGASRVELDTARLAPGRYVVRVVSGDVAEALSLTVVR